jgi:hypothetical protein
MLFNKENYCDIYIGFYTERKELKETRLYKNTECLIGTMSGKEQSKFGIEKVVIESKVLIPFDKKINETFLVKLNDEMYKIYSIGNVGGLNEVMRLYLIK